MFSLLYRKLFIIGDFIHQFCQAVVLNDLLHTLEFLDRNLYGYRFLILINNDAFMYFKHIKPPNFLFIVL